MTRRFVTIVILFVSVAGMAWSVDKDLVFLMSFDRLSGGSIEDLSGNGSSGTLKGDAEISKDGKFGSALSLNGKGYVDCGNKSVLNQEFQGLTIEAWIYPKSLAGIQAIAVKWAYAVAGDHLGLFLNNDKCLIAVADGLTAENGFTGSTPISANTWTHVAGTWNSKDFTYEIYVNGKFDGKGKQGGKGINLKSTETLKIGAEITGQERYFTGLIDEVAIYSRVLTEQEIAKDMKGISYAVKRSASQVSTWASIKRSYYR